MEELITFYTSLGAVGVGFAYLFKNTLDEKKQDRLMYTDTVKEFTQIVRQQGDAISNMNVRMENVEQSVEQTQQDVSDIKIILTKGE